MQKQRDPSFLHTSTTVLHHGDWLGQIAPTSSMSLKDVLTSSSKGGGIHLNRSLKGSLSVMRIACSIALMQPSSLSSKVKMSWKVRTSSLATAAFPGVQEFRPSRFNFCRGNRQHRLHTCYPCALLQVDGAVRHVVYHNRYLAAPHLEPRKCVQYVESWM